MAKEWSDEELILALNLYFKLSFGDQHSGNKDVQKLAKFLERTPGSVNMKLNNFAALDDSLDQEGLPNFSNRDEEIWNRYWNDLEELSVRAELVLEGIESDERGVQATPEVDPDELERRFGRDVSREQKQRVGQRFFRRVVLSNYEHQCGVCRLRRRTLLEAAHILDWSELEEDDASLRVHPRNGLALCVIHHRAFDRDLLRIEPDDLIVLIDDGLLEEDTLGARHLFRPFHNENFFLPEKFGPDPSFLRRAMT